MIENKDTDTTDDFNKILIITDPHGLVDEFREFLDIMQKKHGNTIAYCIQLGDFWKGRNVINGQKTFTFWKDTKAFDNFPFPIYSIKGNEDINIPEKWWHNGMLNLLPDLSSFFIEDFSVIPVHYFEETEEYYQKLGINKFIRLPPPKIKDKNKFFPLFDFEPVKDQKSHPIITDKENIDFLISHVPPYGLLDKTRDAITHKEIKYTGNKLVRLIIDKRKPKIVFFGHNHFANYRKFGDMLVISCDKFVRKVPEWADSDFLDKDSLKKKKYSDRKNKAYANNRSGKIEKEKNLFSYCMIIRDKGQYILEMYRRDKLIFKYDINAGKILISKLRY